MVDDNGFRERFQDIGRLVASLDDISDGQLRTSMRTLIQRMMELHAAALQRVMEIVFADGTAGAEIIDKLGRDSVVSSLLVLHGLHPDDVPTRVERAIEQLAADLRKRDVQIKLINADQCTVNIHAQTNAHACGSTTAGLRAEIEEAIYEAAPEITTLVIEGLESAAKNGFVQIEQLTGTQEKKAVFSKAGD